MPCHAVQSADRRFAWQMAGNDSGGLRHGHVLIAPALTDAGGRRLHACAGGGSKDRIPQCVYELDPLNRPIEEESEFL